MNNRVKFSNRILSGVAAVALGITAVIGAPANGAMAQDAKAMDKSAVENIVRDYLLANPEILIEMQQALEAKQQEARQLSQAKTLEEQHDKIFNSENQMVIGNPDAEISIVEFFDYNCGFCKRALADMDKMVAENPDVKFIMKEFPVLGEGSLQASQVSMAIMHEYPELYAEFHRKLLGGAGQKDGQRALAVAGELGADVEKLKASMAHDKNTDALREVYALADGLGISGTPSYVIGDEVVFGAVGYANILPKVANIRQCGKTVC